MSDPITMGPSELQAYANGRADEKAAAAFVCKYRNSGVGGNDAQECAWPQCGCDPAANRVLEHIQECGIELIDEHELINLRAAAAREKIVAEGFVIMAKDLMKANADLAKLRAEIEALRGAKVA